jgi:prepilin-type N-terminal cleavage/methylation domain-containing protein
MNRRRRSGFTLVEMTVAATLLAVLFGVLGQFVSRWEAARRAADERALALRALENFLEQAAVRDVDADAWSSGPDLAGKLRSPQLRVDRTGPDDLGLVSTTATLSWQNAEGQRVAPVVLTSWRQATNRPAEVSP